MFLSLIECPIFNFEHGAADWTRQGSAFAHQPVFGGSSGHQGNWLIDSYRNVTTPCQRQNASLGEQATGTMMSPPFVIRGAMLSFLIGGKSRCPYMARTSLLSVFRSKRISYGILRLRRFGVSSDFSQIDLCPRRLRIRRYSVHFRKRDLLFNISYLWNKA